MEKIVQIPAQEDFIEKLKLITKEKTNSKAFLKAAQEYGYLLDRIQFLTEQLQEEQHKVINLRERLDSVDRACREVIEVTGQEELI